MTQAHAKRKGVVPRPSEADLRALERLIKRAQEVVRRPCAKTHLSLVQAGERVGRSVILPLGHHRDDSEVVRLIRMAKTWLVGGASPDRLEELAQLAERAAEAVAVERKRLNRTGDLFGARD